MTGDQLAESIALIGWTNAEVARRIGCHESRIRRMIAGEIEIPLDVSLWVSTLAAVHGALRHPPGMPRTSSALS